MEELDRLCVRMMGEGPAATAAMERVRRELDPGGSGDPARSGDHARSGDAAGRRLSGIRAVLSACHDLVPADETTATAAAGDGPTDLSANVARELAVAAAGCSERHRALLALRDLVGLGYAEIVDVLGSEPDDVAAGLAGARIALRERLRGAGPAGASCPERERALRTMARRLDREPVGAPDEEWIVDHLGLCESCARTHAAMLEAAACYRAWA